MSAAINDPLISVCTVALIPPPETVTQPEAETNAYSKSEVNPWMPARNLRWRTGLDWPAVIWMTVIHLGALAARVFYLEGVRLVSGIGLDHRRAGSLLGLSSLADALEFPNVSVDAAIAGAVGNAGRRRAADHWIGVHRKHHRHADKEGDPHSPHDGGWWSHILWLFPRPARSRLAANARLL